MLHPPRYCVLASNACLSYYPNNTLTKFTNVFPFTIRPSGNNSLYVRLRAIAISPELLPPGDPLAHTIQVHIDELQAFPVNENFEKCLIQTVFPPGTVLQHYAVREFDNTVFQPVARSNLDRLSVLVTNSVGEQLRLAQGYPTLLQLEIAEMDTPGHFAVTAMSHMASELAVYPDNTLNNFKIRLSQDVQLANYEVALTGIAYPHDMIMRLPVMTFTFKDEDEPWDVLLPFNLEDFANSRALESSIVQKINQEAMLAEMVTASVERGDPRKNDFGQLAISGASEGKNIHVKMSQEFLRVIPYGTREFVIHGKEKVILGKINLRGAMPIQVGMLYCSCVEESMVGENQHQLMHIVPIERDKYIYEPEHLIFHRVTAQPFNHIHFRLTRPDGKSHEYESPSEGSLIISLLFRPIQQYASRTYIESQPADMGIGGGGGVAAMDTSPVLALERDSGGGDERTLVLRGQSDCIIEMPSDDDRNDDSGEPPQKVARLPYISYE
jgi:hypothetical protein